MTNPSASEAVRVPPRSWHLFGVSAEVSPQRSFRTMRTCTLCCCFCLPHYVIAGASRYRLLRSAAAQLTVLWLSAHEVYSTDTERLVRDSFKMKKMWCLLLYEGVMCFAPDGGWSSFFPLFPAFYSISLISCFLVHPLAVLPH